jgi:putative transposase
MAAFEINHRTAKFGQRNAKFAVEEKDLKLCDTTICGGSGAVPLCPAPLKFPQSDAESAQPEGADDMRKSRFTEAQIIGMIKEQEAGLPTAELCRKHGLSPATFYKLKAKYGGMDVSDAKRLKQLEDENAKLKRLVADVMLDNVVLKDLLGKP